MSLTIRKLKLSDDLETIGRLVYYTDPYIYTALFENDIDIAKKVIPYVVKDNSFYNYKNITVCLVDGKIAGYMTVLKKVNYEENRKAFKDAFLSVLGRLSSKYEDIISSYFDLIKIHKGTNEIFSLSVLPEFRRMGIADALLNSLEDRKVYRLACIKDNSPARKLYAKHGFEYDLDYAGYIGVPCVELVRPIKEK